MKRIAWVLEVFLVLSWFVATGSVFAQVFDERFDDWPIDLKIQGIVALSDSESISPDHLKRCFSQTNEKSIAVISDVPLPKHITQAFDQTFKATRSVLLGDIRDLPAADVFGFYVGESVAGQNELNSRSLDDLISKLFKEGKTLLIIGPLRDRMGVSFMPDVRLFPMKTLNGLNCIPDGFLISSFDTWDSVREQFHSALESSPRHVGISLERRTTLILEGRRFRVVGEGQAHFCVAKGEHHPSREFSIAERKSRGQSPSEWQVDLTEWRRDAIDRTLPLFPPREVQLPHIANGALVIVGGGGLPEGLMNQFVELAGGTANAKLVYVPCSEEDVHTERRSVIQTWQGMGVQQTALLHTKNRLIADKDESFLEPLRDATGIWFGGGRQWNLADSYYGTTAHRLMKEVLHRGGVIGGSSAGASIQARYLARATPIENFRIMAAGYERGGLGFIDGVAIDQHFTQRNRHPDMEQLVLRYPQLLGIGIDEGTAIVVQKSIAGIVGKGQVFFYNLQKSDSLGESNCIGLSKGDKYDLRAREPIDSNQ